MKKLSLFILMLGVSLSLYGNGNGLHYGLFAAGPLNTTLFIDGVDGTNLYQEYTINLPHNLFVRIQRVGDYEIGKFIGVQYTF